MSDDRALTETAPAPFDQPPARTLRSHAAFSAVTLARTSVTGFQLSVDAVLGVLIVALGVWAVYAQICFLGGLSFTTLRTFAFVPVLAGALVLWHSRSLLGAFEASGAKQRAPDRRGAADQPTRWVLLRFGVVVAIGVAYALTRRDWLFWFTATGYLTLEAAFGPAGSRRAEANDASDTGAEIGVVLALCILAALLASGTLEPGADDAYFFNAAVAVVEFPDLVPNTFDALHRGGLPPVEQGLHLPETYGTLVGLLSVLSGRSIGALFYVVLPAIWAFLATLANWALLRQFLRPRAALWGVAVFVLVFVAWGDGNRTFGSFGLPRLYQGKAFYLAVFLPLVVLAAIRFRERPGPATWILLALSQCAAFGITVSGIVVAPLAAGLVLIVRPRFDRASVRTLVAGVAASLPVIAIAAAITPRMAPFLAAGEVEPLLPGYSMVLGDARTPLVLLALLLLPLLAARARLEHAGWLTGYVWCVVLIVFMPATAVVAAHALGPVFSWRIFWAVPVPFLLSLAGAIALGAITERRALFAAGAAAWCLAFLFAGRTAVTRDLFSVHNIGLQKVGATNYAVAEATVARARADAPAVVPERIAIYMTHFPGTPPLIGVRSLYLMKLRGFVPDAEIDARLALFNYLSGPDPTLPFGEAIRAIDSRGIGTVVFRKTHRDSASLVPALTERGFAMSEIHGFVIAAQPK